jgi:hypothetical protein
MLRWYSARASASACNARSAPERDRNRHVSESGTRAASTPIGRSHRGTETSAGRLSTLDTMTAATSAGSAVGVARPSARPDTSRVRTAVGSTAVTLTPVPSSSARTTADSPTTAYLPAQ